LILNTFHPIGFNVMPRLSTNSEFRLQSLIRIHDVMGILVRLCTNFILIIIISSINKHELGLVRVMRKYYAAIAFFGSGSCNI